MQFHIGSSAWKFVSTGEEADRRGGGIAGLLTGYGF